MSTPLGLWIAPGTMNNNNIERRVESLLFASRWLLVPFFVGLIVALLMLLVRFYIDLVTLIPLSMHVGSEELLVGILSLVDTLLLGNLLVIIILAGYEGSVSRIDEAGEQRLEWMGQVGFADLKLKVIGSIVAFSAIELLRIFLTLDEHPVPNLAWRLGIHATFVVSGVLFAWMDRLASHD